MSNPAGSAGLRSSLGLVSAGQPHSQGSGPTGASYLQWRWLHANVPRQVQEKAKLFHNPELGSEHSLLLMLSNPRQS